jgi:hypothetical protein
MEASARSKGMETMQQTTIKLCERRIHCIEGGKKPTTNIFNKRRGGEDATQQQQEEEEKVEMNIYIILRIVCVVIISFA